MSPDAFSFMIGDGRFVGRSGAGWDVVVTRPALDCRRDPANGAQDSRSGGAMVSTEN